jgi:hypothetical protein
MDILRDSSGYAQSEAEWIAAIKKVNPGMTTAEASRRVREMVSRGELTVLGEPR